MLIDTHTHINAEQFNEDVEATIERARTAGVSPMLVVGFDTPTIDRAIELAEAYEDVYAIVGWHPVDAIDCTEAELDRIEALMAHPKVMALGEIGLDYHWDKSPKDVQQRVFRQQIAIAKRTNMPIVIHNREATADVLDLLEEEHAEVVGGVFHSYSMSVELLERCLKLNFYISLGGPVTFKNAKVPKKVAQQVPLDRLLVETDCPYLTPTPFRGKRNEPAYVTYVAEEIAALRGMPYEALAEATTANAKRLFRLP
ncbi:TatD family deoxyribonuclease [Exiguobacterium sp. SH3S2]|uniref:TatD family hydrolase n=1 Tax=unclassified Exiguobacterium TaxID=2644629 RepID=UPI00103CF9A9|nr:MULTISPECIES: TatD family hydrolase [unclassified Exiguobacterium]TCI24758.1 TatD family deoxyribonuclease [Exiguobacterium sp. SH5S4]TCI42266.1 TatD family deoxyribonuclease [Exiguobacterium sp. SH3S3]TCI50437.1 TatD family deoxyribonuclease [Exiguobacterium sp. SH5S13]TCI58405.1 TatD family deoxyribonuclease [Exiguobacterium sp. SH3S2]TCI59148.1 TatD family deoxyribonuclease [Exiguobacterium sp. SH3S1]